MTAFEVFAKLGFDDSEFRQGIDKAEKSGKNFSNSLSDSFGKIKKAAAAIVSVALIKKGIDTLREFASATAAAGDKIDKQSQVLGMSRKAYQEWDYILSQNGSSIDSMSAAMKTLNNTILSASEESSEAGDAFAQLGMHIEDLNNLSQEDQFEAVVRAFQKMPAGAQKSALAVKLFGRQGMQLLPLLNNSATSIDELRQKAEELGLIMSDDAVDASVEYTDALDTMQRTFNGLKYSIGAKVLPILTGAMTKITNFAGKLKKAYDDRGLAGVWDTLVEGFKSIKWPTWDDVKNALIAAWNGVKEGAKSVLKLVFGENAEGGIDWPTAAETWGKIKEVLTGWWDAIKSYAGTILKFVFGEDENGGIDFPTANELGEKVREGLKAAWEGVKTVFSEIAKLVFGGENVEFPASSEEWWNTIKDTVTTLWNGVKTLAKSVINFALGVLGLPDIDQTVARIKTWWANIKRRVKLALQVSLFGFNSESGQTWAEGVQSTNEKFGIHLPQLSEEDIARYADDSFAVGTPTIPYDNFIASLHRGERVLTASQARDYKSSSAEINTEQLANAVSSAVRSAIENATIRSYINGRDVTDEVNRTNMRGVKARRFAT